ncbi:MAG: cobyric acid synthase [Eubacteriales bacterium]|nr:cobyric acid synthase [Eubacteriales bacterium]
MKRAKCIMVQGTMSGAGKSLLCAALCRIFRQDGYRAAPFKSQNMALNSYVTRDGLEMGRAQVVQAQAAGVEPDVRMNPILLKPSSDVGSQVIVLGEVRGQMSARDYFRHKTGLIPEIMAAYESLAGEYDIIVIEGAGSPAEINLKTQDIVNMGLAKLVDAPVLLAGDIDRGGVFAQLYGTVALLEPEEQQRIVGLIVNKFRGDPEILRPGLKPLEEKTGIPVLGIVPYLRVDVDDEDSLAPCLETTAAHKPLDAAVIRLPHISNFTDFTPLEAHPLVGVRYVTNGKELGSPDIVILPGTKSTIADLLWLRQNGLEGAIAKLASDGTPVLGVCGGYQMLGRTISDPLGAECGEPMNCRGMGLLPTDTVFSAEKTRTRVRGSTVATPLDGAELDGYEIHMGKTQVQGRPFCILEGGTPEGCVAGNVFGTYLHGLFDEGELTEKLAAWLCSRRGLEASAAAPVSHRAYQEQQFDLLALGVRESLDMEAVYRAMGLDKRKTAPGTGDEEAGRGAVL